MTHLRTTPIALLLALASPAGLAAQRCTTDIGVGVAASVGTVHYAVAGGLNGTELGGEVHGDFRMASASVSYHRVMPERGEIDPDVVRARVAVPLIRLAGFRVCGLAFGGVSLMAPPDDGGTDARVVAGGAGGVITRSFPLGVGSLRPFLTVRGAAASSSGSVLGIDVGETGLSLGTDLGAALELGTLELSATASLDGFDPALGLTPYPDRAIRVTAGLRF